MTDYSDYSYSSLLKFLVKEDKYDNEGVNYADVLLSMSGATSIEEMVTVYNRVFKKISYYVFWHSLPDYWFITESWDSKQYLANELNKCYNENLLRLYKSLDNPTKDDYVSGSALPRIVLKDFKKFRFVIAPIEVQSQIIDAIRSINSQIYIKDLETRRLADLRDTLLPRLMSGELKVNDMNIVAD